MKTLSTLCMGVVLGALSFHVSAQNESDVLRYGWVDPLHSARVTAMGGSFGALGADLSSLGMNPAGLGLYRRGDLSVNAGIHSGSTESHWRNRKVDAAGSAVVGSNIGVALTYPSVDADWPFFTLAVAHQNRNPFAQNINIEGVPADLSVSDVFVAQALDDAATYGFLNTDSALGDGIIFLCFHCGRRGFSQTTQRDIRPSPATTSWSTERSTKRAGWLRPKSDLAPCSKTRFRLG